MFITLFNSTIPQVPVSLSRPLEKLSKLISVSLLPYVETESTTGKLSKELGHWRLNASFLPENDEGRQIVNITFIANDVLEKYNEVELPGVGVALASTSIPQVTRAAYEGNLICNIIF